MDFRFIAKTASFVDRPEVRRRVKNFERSWLLRIGSFTRTAARQSIRARKTVSKPGRPPSKHSGGLKNSIFFALTAGNTSVVIGPQINYERTRKGRGDNEGAKLLEFGGTVRRNGAVLRYQARPFMAPALRKATEDLAKKYPTELPKMFAGGVIIAT